MTPKDIKSLFSEWNHALKTREPRKVLSLYAENAILLPTISNQVRHSPSEIEDYFVDFLAKGPQGNIEESNVRIWGDIAINSGVYTFSFDDGAKVQARYTFVYRKTGDSWKIVEHHSSQMPEQDV